MNLLNKLTLKNLILNKKRTIVTIIGIILSVALITAVAGMFLSARQSLINFEIRQRGDFHYAFKEVKESDIKYFKENRNFEEIYYTKDIGYAKLENSKNEFKPYIFFKSFTKEGLTNLGINLVDGRMPENDHEIVIPTHLKTNGRIVYNIGDILTLEVGKRVSDGNILNQSNPYNKDVLEEIVDTETKEYKIVGIVERPSNIVESYQAPGYTFITLLDEDKIDSNVDIFTKFTKEALKKDCETAANVLEADKEAFCYIYRNNNIDTEEALIQSKKLGELKYNILINDYLIELEAGLFKESTTKSLAAVVAIIVLIIIFTSVFCIKNSFNISITEKTKQYGMLSTVGATRKQIKKNVYCEALMLGLIGIPIGIICGLFASYVLIIVSNIFLKNSLNIELVYCFSYLSIVFATILGLVTLYLSAWHSAHKASKITPITAIRNSADIKITSKKVKSPKYIKKIFGIGGDVSYKNLKRNKKKYRATVISIIVCVSVFIALSSFINLAFKEIKMEFSTTDYNISLDYREQNSKGILEKARSIVNLDNINDYAITANENIVKEAQYVKFSKEYLELVPDIQKPIEYTDDNNKKVLEYNECVINVFRIGDHAYQKYLKELGLSYEDAKDKGILINTTIGYYPSKKNKNTYEKKTISMYDYKKGDILNWNYNIVESNENKKEELNIELISVTDKFPFGLQNTSGEISLIVSDEYFNKLFSSQSNSLYETIYIDSSNASKLQDEIDELLKDYDYSLINREENVKMMESFYTLIAIFLYGFIIVIALIGITNIFNTITTNMELRSCEFATLKSVGMTKKEFNKMIRLESFFYGMKSLLIGIPIGIILSYLIFKALVSGNELIKYELPFLGIIISTLAVFILITCIMKYSINKINKQNTIETIRNENI